MKNFFQFLKDNSPWSTTRIVTFLITIVTIFYMFYQMFQKLPIDFTGISMLLGVVISGKVVQSFTENKNEEGDIKK